MATYLPVQDRPLTQPHKPTVAPALVVETIDSKETFLGLEQAWKALYAQDQESGYFLSWGWISKVFHNNPDRIRILAVRKTGADAGYIAFFPVTSRIRWSNSDQNFQGILEPGGRVALSELTGFLCNPDTEKVAISAIADSVSSMPWTRFSMRYEPTGRRSEHFLKCFPTDRFRGQFEDYRINQGSVDNLVCPQIELAPTYDDYLAKLSSNTRQKIRRFTRRELDSGNWHITQVTADTVDRDITILMDLWMSRWGSKKKQSQARKTAATYRHMMEASHELGALHLPILWQGDRPLVAHGCISDTSRGQVHFVLSGRSSDPDQQNSGLLLHSDSIRRAIENGFSIYDFGHGDEPYKSSLGGTDKRLNYIVVERLTDEIPETIDLFNITDPARKIRSFIDKGDMSKASIACDELLKIMEAKPRTRGPLTNIPKDLEAQSHD